jgi:hypothetical protein
LTSPPLIEEARSAMPTKKELPDNWPVLEHAGLLDAPAPWEDPSAWRFDRDRREYVLRRSWWSRTRHRVASAIVVLAVFAWTLAVVVVAGSALLH